MRYFRLKSILSNKNLNQESRSKVNIFATLKYLKNLKFKFFSCNFSSFISKSIFPIINI